MDPILIEISIGELFDRMSILEIKLKKIQDKEKLANIIHEYTELSKQCDDSLFMNGAVSEAYLELMAVNEDLWNVEDKIRIKERDGEFGEEFIGLARAVYIMNDQRAKIKRELNARFSSSIVEEKQYVDYTKQ